jgi:hypothetical protein
VIGRITKCRSCGAAIVWCVTENDRLMPVDAQPDLKGNVVALWVNGDGKQVVKVLPAPPIVGTETSHHSHFTTCPYAKAHRKKAP